jgi:hypothetical protein
MVANGAHLHNRGVARRDRALGAPVLSGCIVNATIKALPALLPMLGAVPVRPATQATMRR